MQAPYRSGSLVVVDGRPARVMHVVPTDALGSSHRWRLLCRWLDSDHPIDEPLYCSDEGVGPMVRPAGEPGRLV